MICRPTVLSIAMCTWWWYVQFYPPYCVPEDSMYSTVHHNVYHSIVCNNSSCKIMLNVTFHHGWYLSDIVRDIVTVKSIDEMNDVQVMTPGIWVIPRVCWIAKWIPTCSRQVAYHQQTRHVNLMPVQRWTTVASSGHQPFNTGQCFMLAVVCSQSTSCHRSNVWQMLGQRRRCWAVSIQP